MEQNSTTNSKKYFFIVLLISLTSGFIAAYISYNVDTEGLEMIFLLPLLLGPAIVAVILIYRSKNEALKDDFRNRLFNFKGLNPLMTCVLIFLMPLSIVISVLISGLFGESLGAQFTIADDFSSIIIIGLIASLFEEVGWKGYGLDSIRKKNNLFRSSWIFILLWGIWHLPLFFVQGQYHNEIISENLYYGINFFLSTIPLVFIMNWLYYKTNRSIIIQVLFHTMTNFSAMFLAANEFSKCIQTFVLLIPAIIIILKNKEFFFTKEPDFVIDDANSI